FDSAGAITEMPTQSEVDAIKDEIQAIVAQVLDKNGVAADVDLLSTPFDADSKGFDRFLDNSPVVINNNQITIIINDPVTNIQNLIVNKINLDIDFTSDTDTAPTVPGNLRAVPASDSEIVVVWDASTDDKGVAGYHVYRNGEFVGMTPYPVYRDTGLVIDTNYTYEVEAIDGRGQVSDKAGPTKPLMLDGMPDTKAPPAPTALQASADNNSATLSWLQTEINDVVGFRILRGAKGNATTPVATVTSTTYTDLHLVSATEYCYRIEAYDAAGNTSAPGSETCVTTDGTIGPSSVSFSSATYKVDENAASITITVNRAGDISEAISVDYAASNGTAVDGEDFSAMSGTLDWAANDSNAKTFAVQIMSDSTTEGDETVNLALSSPSASTSLGANTTAVLTIVDIVMGVCNGEITDGNITVDTTLNESCYKVPNGISVNSPAQLTINPGVRLEFAAGTRLEVNTGASLYAVGTAAEPILFTTGGEELPGYWAGILFWNSNSLNNQLDYVTIEYGVDNIDTYATSPVRLNIKNTTSRYASNLGMGLYGSSVILDAFEKNILTLNDRPVSLPAERVGALGGDSQYIGNTDDRIHVFNADVSTAQTWQKQDVPYYLSSSAIYDIDAALTLEAGVSLTFNLDSGLSVNSSGSLKAIGTAAEPILFTTGGEELPGYWAGILFWNSNSLNNQLDYVTVEYAGGQSSSGNITSYCTGSTRFSVTNSTIKDSAAWGIYKYSNTCNITLENNAYNSNASGDTNIP
ncbi:Chitinase, partial [hydrothermal vent metagenome]